MRILQVDEKVEHYVQSDRGVLRRKSKDIWQCEKTTLDLNCISGWYTLNPDWAAKVEKAFQEFMQESQKEPETMLYDWDDKEIPEWVEWIAADGDREVYGFSHKPDFDVEYCEGVWLANCEFEEDGEDAIQLYNQQVPDCSSSDSLEQRPESVTKAPSEDVESILEEKEGDCMGDVENGLQDAGRVFNESAYNVLFKSGRTVSVWTMDWEDLLTICEGINKRENEFVDVLLRVEGGDWQARIVGEGGYVFVSVDNVRM